MIRDRFYSHLLDKGQSLVSAVVEEIISDVSSTLGRCKRFTPAGYFFFHAMAIVPV